MLLKKDPKVSRDYLEIETDAQSLLRIIIMKVFRRDLQGIFLGMKDIPTRDVSAFNMVRNLIITYHRIIGSASYRSVVSKFYIALLNLGTLLNLL